MMGLDTPANDTRSAADRNAVEGKGLSVVKVAALIRAEIKEAIKRRELPRARYTVRTSKYSMGCSIDVRATELPYPILNEEAFAWDGLNSIVFNSRGGQVSRLNSDAHKVELTLNAIVDRYHWDKSDMMSDVHHVRFARDVSVTETRGEWVDLVAAKIANAKASK